MSDPSDLPSVYVSQGETCEICDQVVPEGRYCVKIQASARFLGIGLGKKVIVFHPACADQIGGNFIDAADKAGSLDLDKSAQPDQGGGSE